jgi:HK97 family phage major capsid protein
MENNMTKETQEEIVEENNEEIREDMELDILFTPDEELNATLDEVEVKAEETETLESREAVFPLEFRQDETNDRTMEMSISSESPVARSFGLEVLSHREGDIDLTRLMNKAPLLKDHDASQQIGVVENAYLDTQRGKLMSSVRFGRGALASEIFNDVKDGIRTQVSIGYQINPDSMEKSETTDEVRITDWMPMEVSIVSMGADQNVGFGRSLSLNQPIKTEKKEVIMTEETKSVDVEEQARVKSDEFIAKREKEIAEIIELGARHQKQDLAREAIRDGKDLSSFRGELLSHIENKPIESNEIGLTEKEARNFSIVRMAKHQAGMNVDAQFEVEASRAYAEKIGKQPKGFFVPEDVTNDWGKRTMNTTNSAGVVYDDKQYGNLIDALTPYSTVLQANPTVLANNTGNITIPRVSALSTSAWVTEGVAVGASDPTIDTVTLSEKTNGAYTDLTRTLLQNTDGFSVENMVRDNLLRAMGVTWDQASVSGTGAGGQPTGIENTAGVNATAFGVAGAPTYAEYIEMQTKIFEDNATLDTGSVRYITTPALYGAGKALATNGAGSPVAIRDDFLDGIQVLISSQVTANTVILGDFSEFIVATWGGLDIQSDPYALSTSGGLRLVALSSVDYAVKHPVSFCVSA